MRGPILLTGAGGDIGIALARVLKQTWPQVRLIGADCDPVAVGAEFVDRFDVLPRADAPEYLDALETLALRHRAKVLIPLAEAELHRLYCEDRLESAIGNARVVVANRKALATGLDKLKTAQVLGRAGITVPESGIVGIDEPGDFDLIIKPRCGQGSKGLLRLPRAGFAEVQEQRKGYLWQRWLKDENAEYTCGIARFSGMPTRSLSFRRTLRGGLTGSGEVVHDARLVEICEAVAVALDLDGAINAQLRMDEGRPVIFEINPRLSSTVGFRHRLGFHDAIWAIEARLGLPIGTYDPPLSGMRIARVASEVVRPPMAQMAL